LGPLMNARGMYLAGGTAVALRLGHRQSVDLDWFSPSPIDNPRGLAADIRAAGAPFTTLSVDRGTLHGEALGVRVSLLEYRYPPLHCPENLPGVDCQVASLDDLAAMKLVAIAQRGAKKDFVDVYALGIRQTLGEALAAYRAKYSVDDVARVLYSLTYFDDAELDPMPLMLWKVGWEEIKSEIRRRVAVASA
jgi:hypothetical protein